LIIALWSGSTALTKTVAGPEPAEYVTASLARRLVPSSRMSTVTAPTTASG